MLKPEVRIIAWDDGAFRASQKIVPLVGIVFRGASFLDGVLKTTIRKDGMDATEKIASAIQSSRHYDQLSYIMTDGISFGGLNIVDMQALHARTKLPVLAVVRQRPDRAKFIKALGKLPDAAHRAAIVKKTGVIRSFGTCHYQAAGMTQQDAEELLKLTCIRSHVPEPLRVAHLIASGLSGESRGRA